MHELLDPWDDAARISARIGMPGSRLVAVIGAESWCEKCRNLKPALEEVARHAPASDVILWLDVEDHQEFLGQYLPESLPEVLIYEGTRLTSRSLLSNGDGAVLLALLWADLPKLAVTEDPGIAQRLVQKDWA
jgi:thiol-disulfide isomerase/thioredoxin